MKWYLMILTMIDLFALIVGKNMTVQKNHVVHFVLRRNQMSEDRKPIKSYRVYTAGMPMPEKVCPESEVRELESLLKSKEALLDKAVEVLEDMRTTAQCSEKGNGFTNLSCAIRSACEGALTEIKEKRC